MGATFRLAAAVVCAIVGGADAAAQTVVLSRADYPNDIGARGIVAADFDGDGAVDFATANTGRNTVTIFLNRLAASGVFVRAHTYTVSAGPFAIAAADLNHDGRTDLAVAAADGDRIELLMGSGGGAFTRATPLPAPGNPRGVTIADINGDGHPDLIYTSFLLNTVAVMFGDGTGGFPTMVTSPTGASPQDVVAADFNGDQAIDLAVANTAASTVTLLIGDGTGAFGRTELAGAKNLNVLVAGDFNQDGWIDLAGASTSGNAVAVYLNSFSQLRWKATFTTSLSSPRGIAAADLNGDGFPELIVANRATSAVTIFVGSAAPTVYTSTLKVAASAGSRAVAAADFNGDGRIDFAVGNDSAAVASVFSNRATYPGVGAAAWELHALPPADPAFPGGSVNVAVADFNHNGIPDVVAGGGVVLDATTPIKVGVSRQNATYGQVVVGDFNGDGNADFARFTQYGPAPYPVDKTNGLDVFLGDGRGGFVFDRLIPLAGIPSTMVAGDVNGDGRTDLLFQDGPNDQSTRTRRVLLGRADGSFAELDTDTTGTPFLNPFGLADFNRDGRLDLFTMADDGVIVWFGDGTGRFPSSVSSPPGGSGAAVIGDVNEDGIPDVISNGGMWLGQPNGTFAALRPLLTQGTECILLADLTGDGHLDVLTSEGALLEGRGDGTFGPIRPVNIEFAAAVGADVDRDGLTDVVLTGFGMNYAAMILYNRKSAGPNLPPVADVFGRTLDYSRQFDDEETLEARAYDPNLDPLTYRWLDASGTEVGSGNELSICCHPAGTYRITLVARDDHGAEGRSTATLTILPTEEIVLHATFGSTEGTWQLREDDTAADGVAEWDPNQNAAKIAAPLAEPANSVTLQFTPDPTQEYKLWIRLKAERDNWANDSVFVQFAGAVDASGNPVYEIGTTSALAVNLEECTGCGDSGWGWRDDAWGAKGIVSSVVLRFPRVERGGGAIRIQTREDGVMFDQIVLSSKKYKTARPGAVKNDTVILDRTTPF